jgi:ferric-dicitrate binding protein FerR (iron transport regulator)
MDERAEKINALLLDNRFVDWVLNPQSPYSRYWLQWRLESEENAVLADEARRILLEIRKIEEDAEGEANNAEIEEMWVQIQQSTAESIHTGPIKAGIRSHSRFMLAAGVFGILLVSALLLFIKPVGRKISPTYREDALSAEVIRYNGGVKNEMVFLPDGSKINLAKGARITYDRFMKGKTRKICLTGEAFFEVAKNPDRPFYIYTPNMVVKVLGTSFRVTATAKKELVAVKTGKVSVYLKGQDLEQSAPRILLPRQVCTYLVDKKLMEAGIYNSSENIELHSDGLENYQFEDAPIDTVLQTIQDMYAIPVYYDKEAFRNCYITISLGKESLEEKLQVITKTIGASFSISGYGITIDGKGCK